MRKSIKLSTVIVSLILLAQTLVFIGLATFSYWDSKTRLYDDLESNLEAAKTRLNSSLPVLLWNFNEGAINRNIEAEVNNDSIEAIAIVIDEEVEYQIIKPWQEDIGYELSDQQLASINQTNPVKMSYSGDDGEGHVGDLLVLPSYEKIKSELKSLAISLLIQNIILNVSLAFLILFILYKFVIHPINKTNKGLREITRENNDLSKRLDENNIGELGELAANYNKLAKYVSTTLDERENALDKAEESTKLKSEFLASMSHEIRTPMNGVLGMLDLMLNGELDEQQHHYATLARNSAESLLVIINDILDFSKIEAGKLELDKHDFNLNNLLGEIAESIAMRAQDKGLELILDIKNVEESTVFGDKNRIRQILNNIIGNAIKFTHEGEILISAVLKNLENNSLYFKCDIIDTGIGIPEEKQHLLFDSFSQVDASTTREYGGTGLGLAIVNQLCSLMSGQVEVISNVDRGSCFSVSLTLEKSDNSQKIEPEYSIKGKNILLIDNHETNLCIFKNQLEHWQATVYCEQNAKTALDFLEKNQNIDLVIISMDMEEMSGIEVGEKLKNQYPSLKKVILTTMADKGDPELFKQLNFQADLPKPITTEDWFNLFDLVFNQSPEEIQEEPQKDTTNSTHIENKIILLVEDNMINQQIAVANLEMLGFQVDVAENGLEAIDKLKNTTFESRYHLIFMDCQMPEMDGYQATKAIRKGKADNTKLGKQGIFSGIPIVAMTANAMKGDREKCIASGMDDYMSKPIDPDELQAKLTKWLN
jgi:signal transduction histidine kinase/CheY-like chemotaxis protein